MKATHTLAFIGDMLVAGVKIGEDLESAIKEEVPFDVAEAYEAEGVNIDVYLSDEEVDGGDCIYSTYDGMGFLPDNEQGVPSGYAYRA